jgi:hypothetical protein
MHILSDQALPQVKLEVMKGKTFEPEILIPAQRFEGLFENYSL